MATPPGQEYLDRAKAAYEASIRGHRDNLLECGRSLHLYVLEVLKSGEGLSINAREERKINRENAIKTAAEQLGTYPIRANNFISAAMVVELLGQGGIGTLPWSTINEFSRFIRRKGDYPRKAHTHYPITRASEEWVIRKGMEEKAVAMFRRAVAENWGNQVANVECRVAVYGERTHRRRLRQSPRNKSAIEQLSKCIPNASPGDVADLCLDLISKAESPAAVAIRLRVMLEKYLTKKKVI